MRCAGPPWGKLGGAPTLFPGPNRSPRGPCPSQSPSPLSQQLDTDRGGHTFPRGAGHGGPLRRPPVGMGPLLQSSPLCWGAQGRGPRPLPPTRPLGAQSPHRRRRRTAGYLSTQQRLEPEDGRPHRRVPATHCAHLGPARGQGSLTWTSTTGLRWGSGSPPTGTFLKRSRSPTLG